MKNKTINIGIFSKEEYKQRTISIAKGEYIPKENEPKIWFESLKSLAQVLSNENKALLRTITDKKPQSIKELEVLTNRKKSNLSRTLKTLEKYGIVELKKENNRVIPEVMATDFKVEFGIAA